MFPAAFEYYRAGSVDEGFALMQKHGGDARVLAGGQSLIPAMRYRLARPAVLVDINPLTDLEYIREADGMLVLGALARDAALERLPWLAQRYPLLADVSKVVADPVVRQTGTIVGSLCHNDPAGDWAVAALAGRASVVIRGAKGTRTVPIDEFLVDSFTTAVADGEMALEVRFPTASGRASASYQKLERKVGDFATAAAAAQIVLAADGTVAEAGIAVGAATKRPKPRIRPPTRAAPPSTKRRWPACWSDARWPLPSASSASEGCNDDHGDGQRHEVRARRRTAHAAGVLFA